MENTVLLTVVSIMVAVIGLLSGAYLFVFKIVFDRLNNKCDKDMCAARHEQIAHDLQKGDEHFAKIMDKLENISTTLALLGQRLSALDGGVLKNKNNQPG